MGIETVSREELKAKLEACIASHTAYRGLAGEGCRNVRRYARGLSDWQAAGHWLDGRGTNA